MTVPWDVCMNPYRTFEQAPLGVQQRVGPCNGEYAVAMNDQGEYGSGRWRCCLVCGYAYQANTTLPATAGVLCRVCDQPMWVVDDGQQTHPACCEDGP